DERRAIPLAECREITKQKLDPAGIRTTVPAEKPPSGGGPAFTFALNDDMVRLIHDLRGAGRRIGILTNNVRELREWWWPLMDFEAVFDVIVDSHEVGMRKPNPAIYELTMDRLGATATRTAFLDDLEANVNAALALGMHGIHVGEDSTPAIAAARRLALV
ncbi:MAG: HAD-IA family hydrolase, partial [Actinomycetota bacterium]